MRGTDPPLNTLPPGGLVTVSELREMASRQQQQIESQQQLLVAREQRLKYLRLHESKAKQATLEAERLRRLREKVEAQEAKLRRLRALRGQVDSSVMSAASLSNDLDAMRSLFSEKEKELTDAAAKVDQLTRQLEDVREGRANPTPNLNNNSIHHQELDKLRRELLYRNSVNREACARVASQQEALSARKDEVARIDKRIAELHQRLQRKRVLNHQLASQISAATQAKQAQLKAVQRKAVREASRENSADDLRTDSKKISEDVAEFERGNLDPKYQTLPYNTKFSAANKSRFGSEMTSDYDGSKNDNEQYNNTAQLTYKNTLKNAQENFRSSHQDDQNKNEISPADLNGNKNINKHLNEQYNNEATQQNFRIKVSESSSISINSQQNGSTRSSDSHYGEVGIHNKGDSSSVVRMAHSIPTHPPSRGLASGPVVSVINSGVPSNVSSSGVLTSNDNNFGPSIMSVANSHTVQMGKATTVRSQNFYRGKGYPGEAASNNSNLNQEQNELQGPLPPTSLSVSFAHKNIKNANISQHPQQSNRPMTLSSAHYAQQAALKDVENVRALGYPAGSLAINEDSDQHQRGEGKPSLPPKPPVPTKPTPPPRQKGDPLLGSNESLNSSGKNLSTVRTQLFKYASQNAIVSTYTQDPPSPRSSAISGSNAQEKQQQNQDLGATAQDKVHISINRRIEMPPDFMFPEDETPPSDLLGTQQGQVNKHKRKMEENGSNEEMMIEKGSDVTDKVAVSVAQSIFEQEDNEKSSHLTADSEKRSRLEASNTVDMQTVDIMALNENGVSLDSLPDYDSHIQQDVESNAAPIVVTTGAIRRLKKTNLKSTSNQGGSNRISRRVSFDPLALLLDASLEGELDLVKRTAGEVTNPSQANDEGITALHNAICAGHLDIVTFLVTFGCDVNAQDSDGWTPLHCAASCNNVSMVRFLVEHGACVLATTLSDHETAAEKCEQDEEGYDGCSQYLYSVQEKLGIVNGGIVHAVYDYESQNEDELTFYTGDVIVIIRRGDEYERDWWWGKRQDETGYVPRNLLGLYPRVKNPFKQT